MDDPFLLAVNAFVSQAGTNSMEAYRETALAALDRVRELTPVKTGTLRAGWTLVKADDILSIGDRPPDPEQALENLEPGDSLVLLNPVVYAARIEYGFVGEDSLGRHYDQKGYHMLQQTISELPMIAQAAVQRVMAGQ